MGVSVLSMAGEVAAVPDQTVLVSGGDVLSVGNRNDVAVPETFTVVDGTGRYLMPGLADMHVHPPRLATSLSGRRADLSYLSGAQVLQCLQDAAHERLQMHHAV